VSAASVALKGTAFIGSNAAMLQALHQFLLGKKLPALRGMNVSTAEAAEAGDLGRPESVDRKRSNGQTA
jgi:hypothetical protein